MFLGFIRWFFKVADSFGVFMLLFLLSSFGLENSLRFSVDFQVKAARRRSLIFCPQGGVQLRGFCFLSLMLDV